MTAMSPPTRSTEGQALGFEEFVELHQVSLRRFALALTGNPHDADDLLQDTLVKLYLAWHRLEDHADLRASPARWALDGVTCTNEATGHSFHLNRAGVTLK